MILSEMKIFYDPILSDSLPSKAFGFVLFGDDRQGVQKYTIPDRNGTS